MERPSLDCLPRAIAEDIAAATRAFLTSSGLPLNRMPEYLLQGWTFATRHAQWTMSMETALCDLLKWHGSGDRMPGRVDLAIYDSVDPSKSRQKLLCVVEYKLGWVDLWKDALRTEQLLRLMARSDPRPRLAIVAGVANANWIDAYGDIVRAREEDGWALSVGAPFSAPDSEADPQATYSTVVLSKII